MSWNNIPNEGRLRLWKNLRDEIQTLTLEEQLKRVAEFFKDMPYGSRTVDYYSPSEWPLPWEILFHGTFCKSSISLLIYHTLTLVSKDIPVELWRVDDAGEVYLLPVIDYQYVLNYELGMVSNYSSVSNDIKIQQKFAQEQIKNIA